MKKYKPDNDTMGLMALGTSVIWVLPAVSLAIILDDYFPYDFEGIVIFIIMLLGIGINYLIINMIFKKRSKNE